MAFYDSPAQMFAARAKRCQSDGDYHWALARNGGGSFHYGMARACYQQAQHNREQAAKAASSGATFGKRAAGR